MIVMAGTDERDLTRLAEYEDRLYELCDERLAELWLLLRAPEL